MRRGASGCSGCRCLQEAATSAVEMPPCPHLPPPLPSDPILPPRKDMCIRWRPCERQCGSGAQRSTIFAGEPGAQRQPSCLADHQNGIAVVDGIIDDQVDQVVHTIALVGPSLSQPLRTYHYIDLVALQIACDPQRADS